MSIKCSKCQKTNQLEECEIVGQSFGHVMVNCSCGGTLSLSGMTTSPKFELLSDLSASIADLTSFEEAKLALEFISDGLTNSLDIKFSQDLKRRIERLEIKHRKTA